MSIAIHESLYGSIRFANVASRNVTPRRLLCACAAKRAVCKCSLLYCLIAGAAHWHTLRYGKQDKAVFASVASQDMRRHNEGYAFYHRCSFI